MRFGERLVAAKVITTDRLSEALETQRYRHMRLGRLLRDLGAISQGELNKQLHLHLRPKQIGSVAAAVEQLKAARVPKNIGEWANVAGVIPYAVTQSGLTFIAPCFRDEVAEEAEAAWKRPCSLLLVDLEGFRFLKNIVSDSCLGGPAGLVVEHTASDDQKIAKTDPYTSLFRDTILEAKERGASDIHIQPTRDGLDIRLRVLGDLTTWKTLQAEHRQSFINDVKRLTNLSIAVSGRAQDGRVSFQNWKLDIRSSLLPSQYGEKIVLRLLDLNRSFDLDALGFGESTNRDLKAALTAKNGVVIISGPTGSGKTTTLYTLLSALDRTGKNIITLEDPIEYGIEGLTQVQVGPKLSFADALRAVLRQDPDIILVGEVRDAETADLCVKAALTGHLVLSTLHANGAPEVVSRFLNLGIDPFLLKSCLRFSAAQRLIKTLCRRCRLPVSEAVRAEIVSQLAERHPAIDPSADFRVRNREGCASCTGGIKGRAPVLEYMRGHEIQDFLTEEGGGKPRLSVSLAQVAMELARKGEVDVHDALEIE